MKNQNRNIEHPDLSSRNDKQLFQERDYLYHHGKELCQSIATHFFNRHALEIPIRKAIQDLAICSDRFEAIKEEISYRAEMMR